MVTRIQVVRFSVLSALRVLLNMPAAAPTAMPPIPSPFGLWRRTVTIRRTPVMSQMMSANELSNRRGSQELGISLNAQGLGCPLSGNRRCMGRSNETTATHGWRNRNLENLENGGRQIR